MIKNSRNNKNKLFIINYFDSLKDEIEAEFDYYISVNGKNDIDKLTVKKEKLLNKIYKTKMLNLREFDVNYHDLLKYEHEDAINYYPDSLTDHINSLLFPHFCFHIKNKWLKQVQINKNVMLGYLVIIGTYLNDREMKIFEKLVQSFPIENENVVLNQNILIMRNIVNKIKENIPEEMIQMNYDFKDELIDLNFDKMSISSIEPNVFENCTNLKELSIEYNKLNQINNQMFTKDLQNLTELFLGFNKMDKIEPSSFKFLVNLRILHLNANLIEYLVDDLFEGLGNLVELNLDNNKIKTIGENSFDQMPKLEKLSINNNIIKEIKNSFFTKLTNLSQLYLNSNFIEFIEPFSFINQYSLNILDISMNRLNHLNVNFFDGLSNLEELYLFKNPIKNIEDGVFDQMNKLNVCF